MQHLTMFAVLIICIAGIANAGEADVVAVEVTRMDGQAYRFEATVRHADNGWEHYVNRWEVLDPSGNIIGNRVLAHPHDNEQPFTRRLEGVNIPAGIHQVTVRAHDSVHAYGGKTMLVDLPR